MKTYRVTYEVTIDETLNGLGQDKAYQWLSECIEEHFELMLEESESFSELEITELEG